MHLNITQTKRQTTLSLLITSVLLVFSLTIFAEDKQNSPDLLNQYITSKGYQSTIIFDSSNIKQFWIDNSVINRKDSFEILLEQAKSGLHESVPLKIQLANVNERLDCKVEIISETEDIGFSVLNNQSKVLSSSQKEDNFLKYSIVSSVFHLEETTKMTFVLKFNSKTANTLSIKKIILSFLDNKESAYLLPPGKINYTNKNISTSSTIEEVNSTSFSITGKNTVILSAKRFIVADNTLSSSVTIKNTGETPTTIYLGYGAYTQDHVWLNDKNYPFKGINNVLKVISHSETSNIIIVDSYSEWSKGCHLALEAKEDMSDIPNNNFAGTISEIKKLENGQAEIILSKPLKSKLDEGTKVRIHGKDGAYIYTKTKNLQPGEEQTFTSTIKKDDSFLGYSPKAFSRGVYYVVPIILSYSVDPDKENTVLIKNFTISY